jgi:hypothetical protein
VRGWLAFFLFAACVAALIRVWVVGTLSLAFLGFISLGTTLSASLAMAGALVIEASLLVLTVFGVRLMLRGDARTPDFWATFLLASVPTLVLFDVCLAYGEAVADGTTFGQNLRDLLLENGGARGMLASALWALYWVQSDRVRRTYGRNAFAKATPRDSSTRFARSE